MTPEKEDIGETAPVLIVDNAVAILEQCERMLTSHECTVDVSINGEDPGDHHAPSREP